jgi:hypothetical protein
MQNSKLDMQIQNIKITANNLGRRSEVAVWMELADRRGSRPTDQLDYGEELIEDVRQLGEEMEWWGEEGIRGRKWNGVEKRRSRPHVVMELWHGRGHVNCGFTGTGQQDG